jgi:ferritin-like protein
VNDPGLGSRLHHLMGRAEALAEVADLLDRDHAALVALVERLKALADDPKRQIADLFDGLSAQKRALVGRLADLRDETVGEVSLLRAEIVLGSFDEG